MRNTLFFCLAFFFPRYGHTQTFPLSSSGTIMYEAVVEIDSMKKDNLYANGLKWLRSLEDEEVIIKVKDSVNSHLSGHSSFFVYSQSGLLKKISGRVSYSFSIDTKDNKYRYHFTDFIFHQFHQARTYSMVETMKTKKLEETKASGWQKLWDNHRASTYARFDDHIKSFHQKMKEREMMIVKKLAKKEVEW